MKLMPDKGERSRPQVWQMMSFNPLSFGRDRSLKHSSGEEEGQIVVSKTEVSMSIELHEDVFVFTLSSLLRSIRIIIGPQISLAGRVGCEDGGQ